MVNGLLHKCGLDVDHKQARSADVCARAQGSNAYKLKAKARNFVKIVSGSERKIRAARQVVSGLVTDALPVRLFCHTAPTNDQ